MIRIYKLKDKIIISSRNFIFSLTHTLTRISCKNHDFIRHY